ncbi:MAG: hypothetical protein HY276_07095 [Ignavibacteriales bacterium]|nr:hypothetical protein [Ignavibacteriales bacterium]
MFIGHFAVGLAAKKAAPKVSLGTLFLAVQLLDIMWPVLLLLGWEHVRIAPGVTAFTPLDLYDYPISHSLVTVLGWSLAFALVYYLAKRYPMGAWVLAAGVFSHWLLDFLTHRPDMPIAPGSATYVGLGLWNSVPGTLIVEGGMFVAAVWLYARSTTAKDKIGAYAFWGLIAFLIVSYLAAVFSPPPPNETILAWSALSMWLFIPWAYWIDRHRMVKE